MVIQAFAFYLFAAITVIAGGCVVSSRNPVHAVLFLILAFFSTAGLFVLLGAEFLAMLLVIVYVGAVAVLFLFVVMMLDINFTELRSEGRKYAPIGLVVGLLLCAELIFVVYGMQSGQLGTASLPIPAIAETVNTKAIGAVIYTDFASIFLLSGMILFVAMIGAIVLTHRKRDGVKKQNIYQQNTRTRAESVRLVKVKTGEGV